MRQKEKKVKDLHGCCRMVSKLGRRTGKSKEKASKIESLFEIVLSKSVIESGKPIHLTYK